MSDFDLYLRKKYIHSLAGVMYSDPMEPSFAVQETKSLTKDGTYDRTGPWTFLEMHYFSTS
jgi:hypothetical protein